MVKIKRQLDKSGMFEGGICHISANQCGGKITQTFAR